MASTISNIACPRDSPAASCSPRCLAISMLAPPASGIRYYLLGDQERIRRRQLPCRAAIRPAVKLYVSTAAPRRPYRLLFQDRRLIGSRELAEVIGEAGYIDRFAGPNRSRAPRL